MMQPMPYTAAQQMLDALNPPGNRIYWKSSILRSLDDDVLDTIVDQSQDIPSPLSVALIEFYGGAINRVGTQDTAYPLRDAIYSLNAVAAWTDPSQDSPQYCLGARDLGRGAAIFSRQRVREFPRRRRPGRRARESGLRAKLRATNYRQSGLRSTNLFRLNHNIKPAS